MRNTEEHTDATPTEVSRVKYKPAETAESDEELTSDGGYSASEEEGIVSDRQVLTRNRKRTKSKNGSLGISNGLHRSAYV